MCSHYQALKDADRYLYAVENTWVHGAAGVALCVVFWQVELTNGLFK